MIPYFGEYLTKEQLLALTPQRRKALLRHAQAKVGKYIDDWFDFMPEYLGPDEKRLNDYRKQIHRMVRRDEALESKINDN